MCKIKQYFHKKQKEFKATIKVRNGILKETAGTASVKSYNP